MGRVVHFEIHADDLARAKLFYETVFGWRVEKWQKVEDYYVVYTGDQDDPAQNKWGGIDGGLVLRKGHAPTHDNPVSAYVCTIQVDDLDETSKKIVESAGNIVVQKYELPGMPGTWLCYAKDTEGNVFGVMQAGDEPAAK